MISKNDGTMPEKFGKVDKETNTVIVGDDTYSLSYRDDISEETPYSMRYFSIYVNEDEEVTEYNLKHIAAISEDDVDYYVHEALASTKEEGKIGVKNEGDGVTFDVQL